jgi:hypothetical protein
MSAALWPHSPHAAAMLSFNLQPSRWLHPSRWPQWLPAGWPAPQAADAAQHRHLSALMLQRLGEHAEPVLDPQHREWVFALAPRAHWFLLLRRVALVRAQRRLRHAIRRGDAQALRHALDGDEVHFIHQRAEQLGPADAQLDEWPLAELVAQLDVLGAATLNDACVNAPVALGVRVQLRGPVADAPALDADSAHGLAWRVLQDIDPSWTSSFPSSH